MGVGQGSFNEEQLCGAVQGLTTVSERFGGHCCIPRGRVTTLKARVPSSLCAVGNGKTDLRDGLQSGPWNLSQDQSLEGSTPGRVGQQQHSQPPSWPRSLREPVS